MNSSILKKQLPTQNCIGQQAQQAQKKQEFKISCIPIAPNSLTNQQLLQIIQRWDVYFRIDQKFGIWGFNFAKTKFKNIPRQLYNHLIHYFCLKKLQIVLKDYHENLAIQSSFKIKQIYKNLSLSGKLKGDKFNCLLLVTVKLLSYFMGSQTSEVDTDFKLETEIFVILNYVILGVQVSSKTYEVIRRHHIKKVGLNKQRASVQMKSLIKNKSNLFKQGHQKISQSKKRIGKYSFRSGSALFESLYHLKQSREDDSMQKFKQEVRNNLFVKQFVPKPKLKENLNQLISKNLISDEMREKHILDVKNMQNEMKHKKIFFTQLSSSMVLDSSIQLNEIKSHYIQIRPEKISKYYQIVSSQSKKKDFQKANQNTKNNPVKTGIIQQKIAQCKDSIYSTVKDSKDKNELQIQDKFSLPEINKNKKQKNYWNNLLCQMKQNKFRGLEKFPPINFKGYFQKNDFQKKFNEKYKTPIPQDQLLKSDRINNELSLPDQKILKNIVNKMAKQQELNYHKQKVEYLDCKNDSKNCFQNNNSIQNINQRQIYKQWKRGINVITYSNYQQQQDITDKKKLQSQKKQTKTKAIKDRLLEFQRQCIQREDQNKNLYYQK